MKRKFLCLLLALTMVLGLAATVSAFPDMYDAIPEDDINDTLWDAQPIELGETYEGQAVAYCGDSDLFTFTLTEKTQIRISMAGSGPEMDLALFDSKGKRLAHGEDLGFWGEDPEGFEMFNIFPMELDAGTYYVGVWTTDGTNHGYWLSVKKGVFPCEGYHQSSIHEFITPATCQSEGEWTCVCLCGATTTETVPANPDVHTFETEIVTPSSCTENGLAIHTCTGCGYVEEETLWADHTAPDKIIIQDPTMDDYGYYYFTCNDCGYVDDYESHLYALDHMFIDVKPGEFYELPVCWAIYKGITSGTDLYHFAPNDSCLRSQVVTFLWRAAGKPVVEFENPFTDVKPTDYYYDAVLWAVSEGITQGVKADRFGPNEKCNRSQVVTFLWRAAGEPVVRAENPFADVKPIDYYYDAVLWAARNGITTGTNPTTFAPFDVCNRSQVVTFLYRADNIPQTQTYTFELLTNDPSEETGFVEVEGSEFAAGESVIFYAEPWYGYLVEFAVQPEGLTPELYYLGGNYYELIMPECDVTLTAHFVPATGSYQYIELNAANCLAMVNCLADEDGNDVAKPGEYVQILVIPDEGFSLADATFTAANGEMVDWWYLGSVEDGSDTIHVLEMVMPDSDVDITITCTPGTAPAAAEVRVPVSIG